MNHPRIHFNEHSNDADDITTSTQPRPLFILKPDIYTLLFYSSENSIWSDKNVLKTM